MERKKIVSYFLPFVKFLGAREEQDNLGKNSAWRRVELRHPWFIWIQSAPMVSSYWSVSSWTPNPGPLSWTVILLIPGAISLKLNWRAKSYQAGKAFHRMSQRYSAISTPTKMCQMVHFQKRSELFLSRQRFFQSSQSFHCHLQKWVTSSRVTLGMAFDGNVGWGMESFPAEWWLKRQALPLGPLYQLLPTLSSHQADRPAAGRGQKA